jgi:uncharacterized protein (TIGR02598 family)
MSVFRLGKRGFSLVEVTLALGLVTFCLLALLALLPAGLDTVKESQDEAAAVQCLERLAAAIREAPQEASVPGRYRVIGAYGNSLDAGGNPYNSNPKIEWDLNAAGVVQVDLDKISAGGFPAPNAAEERFRARVEVTPPVYRANANPVQYQPGRAFISVAWPTQAKWNTATYSWENAQGSVQTTVVLLPEL